MADAAGSAGVVDLARSGLAAAERGGVDSAAVSMCSGSSVSDGEEDGGTVAARGGAVPGAAASASAAGSSLDATRVSAVGVAQPQPRRELSPGAAVPLSALPGQLPGAAATSAASSAAAGFADVEEEGTDTTSLDGETEGDCGSAHSASAQASSIDGDGSMWRDVPRPSSSPNVDSDAEGRGENDAGVSRQPGTDTGSGISQGDLSPPSPASSASFVGADGAAGGADVPAGSPAVKAPVLAAMLQRVPVSRGSGPAVAGAKDVSDAAATGVMRTASALTLRGTEGKDEPDKVAGEPSSGTDGPCAEEEGLEDEEIKVPTVRTRAERRERLQKVPPVLILQLQRFTQTPRGGLRKLSGHVPFPLDLDMSPFMAPPPVDEAVDETPGRSGTVAAAAGAADVPSPPAAQAAARAAKKQRKSRPQSIASDDADGARAPSEDGHRSEASTRSDGCLTWSDGSESLEEMTAAGSDDGEADGIESVPADAAAAADRLPATRIVRPDGQYTLSGVVVHGGSLYAGHYTCYVRGGEAKDAPPRAPGASPAHEWWYCSDSHVSAAVEKDVLAAEAYLLFYTAVRSE